MPPFRYLKNEAGSHRGLEIRTVVVPIELKSGGDPRKLATSPAIDPILNSASNRKSSALEQPAPPNNSSEPDRSPVYQSLHALTKQPQLVSGDPSFIEFPTETSVTGFLLLRLSIDLLGKVNAVTTLRTTLPREIEGQIVLQFYQATYSPGEIDGVPVNSEAYVFTEIRGL